MKIVYGCNSLNDNIRKESSSGGVFSVLAEYYIKNGGVVFGTAMTDNNKGAEIIKCRSENDISKLRGSKYIQSKVCNSYKEVLGELENGTQVLFTGTPCQINGLKLFLNKEYTNLCCVDIICHGVPSPKLWRQYIDYFETKHKGKVTKVNFRSKDISWSGFGMKINIGDKTFFQSKSTDPYLQMFLKNYCLRPSCYNCRSKTYRNADITIGDFWGVENVLPELNDAKGTSAVILRTTKGQEIFSAVSDKLEIRTTDYESVINKNSAEYKSVAIPKQRTDFFNDLDKMSFDKLRKKYLRTGAKKYIKKVIKKIIKYN